MAILTKKELSELNSCIEDIFNNQENTDEIEDIFNSQKNSKIEDIIFYLNSNKDIEVRNNNNIIIGIGTFKKDNNNNIFIKLN